MTDRKTCWFCGGEHQRADSDTCSPACKEHLRRWDEGEERFRWNEAMAEVEADHQVGPIDSR
jgi:hypothetical protein